MLPKILLFVVITLLVTALLAVFQQKIHLDYSIIVLPQLAPALGFIIMALLIRDLRIPINLYFSGPIVLRTLLALILPAALILASHYIGRNIGLDIQKLNAASPSLSTLFLGMLIGALGEELGWRSFLQPLLRREHSLLISSIIVGLIWGMWHIGHYKNGALFMLGFLLFTISASIIVANLLRGTDHNIVISTAFHLSINVGFSLFFSNSLTDAKLQLVNGLVWLAIATGITIAMQVGGKLSRSA